MGDSFVFMPARELGELVRTGHVSPVELAEVFLERLETLGSRYNAVVTVTRERALPQARRAEKEVAGGHYRGPLHGIPYGAKDLFATSGGIPTTWGATPFRDQTFDFDATVVRRLEKEGAVLVAKLAMVELAGALAYHQPNASFTGPGINPWDRDTWSGGASSGSASAVAAGLVPFALGSETWGSILRPSNNCGVTGLRPTYGRISRFGAMPLSWTLDKVGPMCLTADDCGLVLEALAGSDPNDATAVDRPFRHERASSRPERRFRLGVLTGGSEGAQEDVRANFEQAVGALGEVADVDEVEFPDFPYEEAMRIVMMAESASSMEEFIESGKAAELTAPEDRYGPYARTAVLASDYLRALRARGVAARAVDKAMAGYDAVLAPSRITTASPIDESFANPARGTPDVVGAAGNLLGLPAVSVPSGFTAGGLPTGVQFMGRAYDESAVLSVAQAYQSLTDWHLRHPPDLVPATQR